jgi:membrane protein involved in colicin uptake
VTGQPDPSSALHSKIHELETRLSEREQADQQARLNAANQQIEQFKKDRPYFDEATDMMDKLIRSGAAKGLEDAYDMAINAHPEIRAKRDTEAKAEAEKKAAEEAKAKAARDAKINPLARRPGSTPTAPLKGKSIWDTVDHVAADIRARA